MNHRPPFRFDSVAQLEREAARQGALAVLPEMANISEHGVSLSGGRTALLRRFDPGANPTPSPAAVVFMGDRATHDPASEDTLCRYLAEALSLPVVGVREPQTELLVDHDWIAAWWRWCCSSGHEIGLDPTSLVLGARGRTCGSLLTAMDAPGSLEPMPPRGLFLLCGDYRDIDGWLAHPVTKQQKALPSLYMATSAIGHERTSSRRMSAWFLDRCIECWYVEWPGVNARCLDNIERIPEMERYIDAMVIVLRGLLLSAAHEPQTGTST